MRTFIMRSRKGTIQWENVRDNIGKGCHFEIVAHSVLNAFFVSNNFRNDVEFYIVLDSANDFPRTIKLTSIESLSLTGFHEKAIVDLIIDILKESSRLSKNTTMPLAPGIQISGFGFEHLVDGLLGARPIYLLDKKSNDIREVSLAIDPIFILSDHLALPKNNIKSLKRRGVTGISLGKKMLFASQCIVLLHDAMDRLGM